MVAHAGRHRAKQELAFYGHLEGGEGEEVEGRKTTANYLPSRRLVTMRQAMFLERERVTVKASSLMALAVDSDLKIEGMSFRVCGGV